MLVRICESPQSLPVINKRELLLHHGGKDLNDCHKVTEVLAACRYTAPAKDANGCREGTGHMSTDEHR